MGGQIDLGQELVFVVVDVDVVVDVVAAAAVAVVVVVVNSVVGGGWLLTLINSGVEPLID